MKCGNCNIDFPTREKLVFHMVVVHDSPFIDGDQVLIDLSNKATQSEAVKNVQAVVAAMQR